MRLGGFNGGVLCDVTSGGGMRSRAFENLIHCVANYKLTVWTLCLNTKTKLNIGENLDDSIRHFSERHPMTTFSEEQMKSIL